MNGLNYRITNLVERVSGEVRRVAFRLDSSTLRNVGLSAAVGQLCEAVTNSGKIKVTSIVDVQPSADDAETLLNLYRIVQELFTNTLKHAQATAIRFEITQVNNEITIIFEDNGIGFDVQAAGKKSLGLHNIRSRVENLHGELRIESSSVGSTFIIEIPVVHGNH